MPISRRGFLQFAKPGGERLTGAFLAARGLEAHLAEAQTQTRGQSARALLPPGVEEIRISSNENPLGPGRAALDAILGRSQRAQRDKERQPDGLGEASRRVRKRQRREIRHALSIWRSSYGRYAML